MNLNLILTIIIIVIIIYLYCRSNNTEKFISCGNSGSCSSQLCSSGCKPVISTDESGNCTCVPILPTS